jgi:hypothetical protein
VDGKNCKPHVKGPRLRQLEREIRAAQFFRWHCLQEFRECVVDGRSGFRMVARFPGPHLKPRGRLADSLWRPHGYAFQRRGA